MKKLVLLLLLIMFTYVPKAHALVECKADLYFAGVYMMKFDSHIRTHTACYIGTPVISIGGYALYEPLHPYVTDIGYGGALHIGGAYFLDISGGMFERDYKGTKGKGYMARLAIGALLSDYLTLTLPIIFKKIDSGDLDKRMIIDVVPFLGLRVEY